MTGLHIAKVHTPSYTTTTTTQYDDPHQHYIPPVNTTQLHSHNPRELLYTISSFSHFYSDRHLGSWLNISIGSLLSLLTPSLLTCYCRMGILRKGRRRMRWGEALGMDRSGLSCWRRTGLSALTVLGLCVYLAVRDDASSLHASVQRSANSYAAGKTAFNNSRSRPFNDWFVRPEWFKYSTLCKTHLQQEIYWSPLPPSTHTDCSWWSSMHKDF